SRATKNPWTPQSMGSQYKLYDKVFSVAHAAAAAGLVYFLRTGFTITPLRIALVLTFTRTIRPSITARTFWIFGLNLRAVIPVTLVPTPPRYLAFPRWVIWLPKVVFL